MEADFIRLAKRENNKKRNYLLVNRLQGKHVPAAPYQTMEMFDRLAKVVKDNYGGQSVLIIGFAETATAIGARAAVKMKSYYMQTTRENIRDVEYLYFTESHSHATEQKLIKTDLDKIIDKINRIIFVEDEVTTGNTIIKIIKVMRETYKNLPEFAVASIINGMDRASMERYKMEKIALHYLIKTDHSSYTQIAEKYKGDGNYHREVTESPQTEVKMYEAKGFVNARRLTKGDVYQKACEELWNQIKGRVEIGGDQSLLVLGTEEFMYPAIYVADKFGSLGCRVKCHATTRSPIEVSNEKDYPLHDRFALSSVYEDGRPTFLYDMAQYDKVIIITDSENVQDKGINSLINAAAGCKNDDITIVRWCK